VDYGEFLLIVYVHFKREILLIEVEKMVECSKCNRKLGFLSTKHKLENGSILCGSCFDKWKEQQEKNKSIMIEYITKYLSNKDIGMLKVLKVYILGCHKNKEINNLFDGDSLQRVIEHVQTILAQAEYSNKSGMSSYEIDKVINTKKICEGTLNFLVDLEKMYKLFNKKGIKTDYFEILSIFAEVVEQKINKEYDEVLIPTYMRISKRLGKNVSVESVIKELMKIPLGIEHKDYDFEIISRLLNKFGLKCDEEEVEKIIEKVHKDIDLEEFEQDLDSSQKVDIGDFERLTGYEFEGYLKKLFNLLGYTVIQTSLSGDQGADLIISKDGEKIVVQAKKYNGKVSNKAIQEIVAAKNHYKAHKVIVVTNSFFTKSAIDLALSNNVELWDGLKLKNIIQNLKTKKKEKRLESKGSLTLQKGKHIQKIKILCPFCEEEFEYEVDIKEIRGEVNFETKCPHCGIALETIININNMEMSILLTTI